jgi:hypothetical protein
MSVGRDGASDAVSFLAAGVPAVEFGPIGDGHHGPDEWVSVSSVSSYRQALEGCVKHFRGWCPRDPAPEGRGRDEEQNPATTRPRSTSSGRTSSPTGRTMRSARRTSSQRSWTTRTLTKRI